MKKSDFVEVHVYTVDDKVEPYGGGIFFSKYLLNNVKYLLYGGKTLLTKEFWNKHADYDKIDYLYIE